MIEAAEQEWDDDVSEVVKTVGKLVRLWRERAEMTQADLGAAIGYGDEQIRSVERARRIPRPEFLDAADEALGAGGMLAALKEDVEKARYPKKVRDLAKVEAGAVEIGAYEDKVINGLLQTEDYMRALYRMRVPLLGEDDVERHVAARLARQAILTRSPWPIVSFVQEEATLLRPVGGRLVRRAQLERLLEVGRMPNVQLQVMPTSREENPGLDGSFRLIEPQRGTKAAHMEVALFSRVTVDRKVVRVLEARYGMIRAQALTPRESLAYVEKLLGET